MANIPVEKTSSGAAWLPWLLGLLALLALLWLAIELLGGDDDDLAVVDDTEQVLPIDDDDAVSTAGTMDMSGLYVTRVTGDRTFFVAPTEGSPDETLVILDQNMSPDAPGIEGQVDVNAGQIVDLSGGRMEPLGDENLAGMGLSDDEASMMTPSTEVIRIDGGEVGIRNAELDNVEVGE
jgi:hypothetical protein